MYVWIRSDNRSYSQIWKTAIPFLWLENQRKACEELFFFCFFFLNMDANLRIFGEEFMNEEKALPDDLNFSSQIT